MGDIADMLIDGTLDSETGEYLGPVPGYPRTARTGKSQYDKNRVTVRCPVCQKKVKKIGLKDHLKDVHGVRS